MTARAFSFVEPPRWPPVKPGMFAGDIVPLTAAPKWDELIPDIAGGGFQAGPFRCAALGLIGLADDEGVQLNRGHPGAKDGPDAIRQALCRFGLADAAAWDLDAPAVIDCGNIIPGRDLAETHDRVTATVHEMRQHSLLPVGLGGGHDLTWPLVRGVAEAAVKEAGERLQGIYFDAHLDVRETPGSGMAFRRLVEDCRVESLTCIGMEPLANSAEHLRWFHEHGGRLQNFSPEEWPRSGSQFVSIDLDVIDASQAPGVSASNPVGMPASRIAEYAYSAGQNASVCCFDIMELCPPRDERQRTCRLAAYLLLQFIRGCARRVGQRHQLS